MVRAGFSHFPGIWSGVFILWARGFLLLAHGCFYWNGSGSAGRPRCVLGAGLFKTAACDFSCLRCLRFCPRTGPVRSLLPRQAEAGLWLFAVAVPCGGPGSGALWLPRASARSLGFCSHWGTALVSLWSRPYSYYLEIFAQVSTFDGIGSSHTILSSDDRVAD